MKITVIDSDGIKTAIDNIVELTFSRAVDAPCDALSFAFKSNAFVGEVVRVMAYEGEEIAFNGYCDNQKTESTSDGYRVYIYARSSACLLVDNEAEPFTYKCPASNQLYYSFARKFGFKNGLPMVSSQDKYEVTKGLSCYGAINRFMSLTAGSNIYISPDDTLRCFEISRDVKRLTDYQIISCVHIINRSEPISEICYKRSSADEKYNLHTKAQIGSDMKISRIKYCNLSALPQWQREYTINQKLKNSYENYKVLEVVIKGYADEELCQRFLYASGRNKYEEYIMTDKKYIVDKKGKRTRLILKKSIDIKEITYVD